MVIFLCILGGLVGLVIGGELLVRGASNLALAMQVSPLIVGLTVVALGTSAPELAVSLQSCANGKTGLAVGNVVGSNLSNILFILGASALVSPLVVSARLFKLDIPVMIAAAGALWWLGGDGMLTRPEGIGMSAALVVYLVWTVWQGRREEKRLKRELDLPDEDEVKITAGFLTINVVWLLAGLGLLVYGADFLVFGCVELAKLFGLSDLVIGLTVIAIGTSFPELAASLAAVAKGKRDMAVGNVVGSNILNVLCVLGLSSIAAPDGVSVDHEAIAFHVPIMVGVSVLCLPVFFRGMAITRAEGAGMLVYYAAYLAMLVYAATRTPVLPLTMGHTLAFAAPLGFVLALSLWRDRRKSPKA